MAHLNRAKLKLTPNQGKVPVSLRLFWLRVFAIAMTLWLTLGNLVGLAAADYSTAYSSAYAQQNILKQTAFAVQQPLLPNLYLHKLHRPLRIPLPLVASRVEASRWCRVRLFRLTQEVMQLPHLWQILILPALVAVASPMARQPPPLTPPT